MVSPCLPHVQIPQISLVLFFRTLFIVVTLIFTLFLFCHFPLSLCHVPDLLLCLHTSDQNKLSSALVGGIVNSPANPLFALSLPRPPKRPPRSSINRSFLYAPNSSPNSSPKLLHYVSQIVFIWFAARLAVRLATRLPPSSAPQFTSPRRIRSHTRGNRCRHKSLLIPLFLRLSSSSLSRCSRP